MPKSKSQIFTSRNIYFALLIILILTLWWASCQSENKQQRDNELIRKEIEKSGSLTAVLIPDGTPEQLLEYPGFTVSFNSVHHVPNYVAWELTAQETYGTIKRSDKFSADPNVEGCPTPADYRNSGFSRGHMAPAADMKWNADAMDACFYLTNICPQTSELNNGAWKSVEDRSRNWARRDSTIVIVCGPILTDRITRHIGQTNVTVPERFFKVILAPYANPPQGIGFIMPNGYVEGGMQAAAVSIDRVEEITGFDFFSALPDQIENDVESQNNFSRWNRKK